MGEINAFCRLCAENKDVFVKIFTESGNKLTMSSKITQCLQITVHPTDVLPTVVCGDCCVALDRSYEFFQSSCQAQRTLQAIVESKQQTTRQESDRVKDVKDVSPRRTRGNGARRTPCRQKQQVAEPPCGPASEGSEDARDDVGSQGKDGEEAKNRRRNEKNARRKTCSSAGAGAVRIRLDRTYAGWQCTDCSAVLPTQPGLKEHHRTAHSQPVRYQCNECARVYLVYRKFSRHMRLHRNRDKHKCSECGKTFATRQSLDSHSVFHTTARPHVCQHCGKTFRQRGSLYVHRRTHQPDLKQFPCTQCGRQLLSRQALATHARQHTGARDYTCETCGKSFSVKQGLVYHLLSHSGDRPHGCHTCGMRCKTAYLLKKHMSTHSGEKKHQCDVCGKQFRERGTLQQHSRIHTGAMPYACEVCAKAFRFQGALTIHRRQHTGERPYCCVQCGRDFTNWANYNKHMKRRHGLTAKKNYADPTFYSDTNSVARLTETVQSAARDSEHSGFEVPGQSLLHDHAAAFVVPGYYAHTHVGQ